MSQFVASVKRNAGSCQEDIDAFDAAEAKYKHSLKLHHYNGSGVIHKHQAERIKVRELQLQHNPNGIHKVAKKSNNVRFGNKNSVGSKNDGTGKKSSIARPCAVARGTHPWSSVSLEDRRDQRLRSNPALLHAL